MKVRTQQVASALAVLSTILLSPPAANAGDGESKVTMVSVPERGRHLASFGTVAEQGSFTAAATTLGITQAAVSQRIAMLEGVSDLAV
jgi:hypothetical protein